MKIPTAMIASVLVAGVAFGTAMHAKEAKAAGPHEVKGEITKIEREGRVLHINDKKYRVSGSRSDVCIKGACGQDRGNLKVGMKCEGMTSGKKNGVEFKKVSCK